MAHTLKLDSAQLKLIVNNTLFDVLLMDASATITILILGVLRQDTKGPSLKPAYTPHIFPQIQSCVLDIRDSCFTT